MLSTVKLIYFCWLINLSWCAPSMNFTSADFLTPFLGTDSVPMNDGQSIQPNVTISLNCSCIVTTPASKDSKLIINGLSIYGQSDYRCNEVAFKECKNTCSDKTRNQPIFNIDTRSVGLNISNGVNLNDYLCGLMAKGDSYSMVSIAVQMDCTEKSTTFELFNSKSSSIAMSPSTSLNCPTMTTPSIVESTIGTIS